MTSGKNNADSQFVWMQGELVRYQDATVPFLSHSLHYGTAVFEGIRAYRMSNGTPAIFRAEDHYKRFIDSVKALGGKIDYTAEQLVDATTRLIRENGFEECYVRPLAYFDDTYRGLKLPARPSMLTAIAAWNWGKYLGDDGQKNGIRVVVSSYRRADPSTALPWAKISGAYVTSVLARREASEAGVDEAILLDPQGYVAEGSGENLFLVKNGEILTPPTGSILPGLTRECVIEIARSLGYVVREERLIRNQLYLADELFFTGTAVEVTPIREVDRQVIAEGKPGEITRRLMDIFFKSVRGEVSAFRKWLTPVTVNNTL